MKRALFLLMLSGFAFTVNAQKVALHSTTGVQIFTGTDGFSDAYAQAVSGDTIYLPGGGFTVPAAIDKSLRIYGAGHCPDSTTATGKTYFIASLTLSENADGFYLEGVDINGNLTLSSNHAVSNVIIKRCRINSLSVNGDLSNPALNLTIIESVIAGDISFQNAENAGVYNSIVQGRVIYSFGNVYKNNIFFYSYSGTSSIYTTSGDNNLFENNVFWNLSFRYFNGVGNEIYNNLFVTTPGFGTTPIESGNYYPVSQANIFINQTGNAFGYEFDNHLQNPETYLGTDATQVGIYGGVHPVKEGWVPSNPHIQTKNISAKTDADGNLNIQITVEAQNN